ncbi:MAG TPA: hypothetical protein DEB46_13440, partial [Myxococcales bacterium]|nr:hypothetical protein [Myxococcales bacterium]
MSTSVLVIDPSPLVHRTVEASLGREVKIGAARETAQAEHALNNQVWDLVMLATKIANADESFSLAQRIRKEFPGTRLVLMVGVMQEPSPAFLEKVQPDEIIRKPWSSRDLQQLIQGLVDQGPRAMSKEAISESLPPVIVDDAETLTPPESPVLDDVEDAPMASIDEPSDDLVAAGVTEAESSPALTADEESLPPFPEDESLPPFADPTSMVPAPSFAAEDDDLPPLPELEVFEFVDPTPTTPSTDDAIHTSSVQDETSEEHELPVAQADGGDFDQLIPSELAVESAPPPEDIDMAMDELLTSMSDLDALPSLETSLAALNQGEPQESDDDLSANMMEDSATDPPLDLVPEILGTVPPDEAKQPQALSEQLAQDPDELDLWAPQDTSQFGAGIAAEALDEEAGIVEVQGDDQPEVFDPSVQDALVTLTAEPASGHGSIASVLEGVDEALPSGAEESNPLVAEISMPAALPADALVAE